MFARVLSLCVALAAAVVLMSVSSPAVAGGMGIDVSTRAAVVAYLRSIHVDPRGLVIERGTRNYAGAACPGAGWTCTTTAHPVVQVARDGGRNTFRCATASCAVVQVAGLRAAAANSASCVEPAGQGQHAEQACVISQTSATADNKAVVFERTSIYGGLEERATSVVSITQQATGPADAPNSNDVCLYQGIVLDRPLYRPRATTLIQFAHQLVTIKQDSMYGGNSAAASANRHGRCIGGALRQRQTLESTLWGPRAITQKQDADDDGANMAIDVEQNQSPGFLTQAHGENSAGVNQYSSLTAIASSTKGPVVQRQSSVNGGLLGTINQDSRDPSVASMTQQEIQCEDAANDGLGAVCHTRYADRPHLRSLKQVQIGPVRQGVGTATQTGNAADTFRIRQSSTQQKDQSSGSQTSNVHGDCATPGACSVTQVAAVAGRYHSSHQSGQEVDTTTTCTGADCESTCPDDNCAAVDPSSILIAGHGDETMEARTDPNYQLAKELTSEGYSVSELPTMPADVSRFGQVWWVDTNPPTPAEQTQLEGVEESGRGVFLTGEIDCCTTLDDADQDMVNSMVSGGGVTLDGSELVGLSGKQYAASVNSGVVGNLASQPHTVTSWTVTAAGAIDGVSGSSVFAAGKPQDGGPNVPAAAAWDRPSTAGQGRLVLFMDINWAETTERGKNWADVADNVAFFLSGLAVPPAATVG